MKQLFWKEWHDLRWLPVGAAALFSLIVLVYFEMCRLPSTGLRPKDLTLYETIYVLWLTWCLFGVLAGAGLFAQEAGDGTANFLLSLPNSRKKVWMLKVAAGACSLMLAIISSGLIWLMLRYTILTPATDTQWFSTIRQSFALEMGWYIAIFAAFVCYSIAVAASVVVDRYLSAAMIALIISALLLVVTFGAVSSFTLVAFSWEIFGGPLALYLYLAGWIGTSLGASYQAFCRGDAMAGSRRLRVASAWLTGVVTATVVLISAASYASAQRERIINETRPADSLVESNRSFWRGPWSDNTSGKSFTIAPHKGDLIAWEIVTVDGRVQSARPLFDFGAITRTAQIAAHLRVLNAPLPSSGKLFAGPVSTPSSSDLSFLSLQISVNGNEAASIPVTLQFATGIGYFDFAGSSANVDYILSTNKATVLLDELFVDKGMNGVPPKWVIEPNDAMFTRHYPPNSVHRIMVSVSFFTRPSS